MAVVTGANSRRADRMDQIVGFVVLLIILSLLEKVLRGQKGKKEGPPPPPGASGWEGTDAEQDAGEASSASLRELLAEELGLNLERKPSVRRLPESPTAQTGPDYRTPASVVDRVAGAPPTRGRESAGPPEIERVIHYPTPHRSEGRLEPADAPEWGHRIADERKRAASLRKRRSPFRSPTRAGRSAVERGEPISLERPRRPEDHQRFHDRYDVPQPVRSHEEYHARYMEPRKRTEARRAGVSLPDNPEWSAVQRAIIWSEIVGPPKGLE